MDIQSVSAYTTAASGATIQQAREDSGQPPLDRATLDRTIGHSLDHDGQAASDTGESTDESPQAAGGYTSSAQLSAARAGVAGSISILA